MLCAVMGGSMAHAQVIDPAQYERFLLPILISYVPGVYGSLWNSSFVLYNGSDVDAWYEPEGICPVGTCPGWPLLPGTAGYPLTRLAGPGDPPGRLFYVKKDSASGISFALRIKDLSRQALAEGTEIPVVRDSELRTGKMQLLDVPTGTTSRVALRVYDGDATGTGSVRVRIFSQLDGTLLSSTELALPVWQVSTPPFVPGYAQILDLRDTFPQIAAHDRIRVELEPATEGLRYWAFLTVANTQTQFVTTITEQ